MTDFNTSLSNPSQTREAGRDFAGLSPKMDSGPGTASSPSSFFGMKNCESPTRHATASPRADLQICNAFYYPSPGCCFDMHASEAEDACTITNYHGPWQLPQLVLSSELFPALPALLVLECYY